MATIKEIAKGYSDWEKQRKETGQLPRKYQSAPELYGAMKVRRGIASGEIDLNEVVTGLNSRIDSWGKGVQQLSDDYNARFGESYDRSVYRSDSSSWLDDVTGRRNQSDTEAEEIKSLMRVYGEYLNDDYVKSVSDYFDGNKDFFDGVIEHATIDNDYWSQWGSEEEFNTYWDEYARYKEYEKGISNWDYNTEKAKVDQRERDTQKYNKAKNNIEETIIALDKAIEAGNINFSYTDHLGRDHEILGRDYDFLAADSSGIPREIDLQAGLKNERAYLQTLLDTNSMFNDDRFISAGGVTNLGVKQISGSSVAHTMDKGVTPDKSVTPDYGVDFDAERAELKAMEYTYEGFKFNAVANPWSEFYDPEFEEYAKKGCSGITKDDIKGVDGDNVTNEEFKIYGYYKAKDKENGTDLADKYIYYIKQGVNERKGQEIADRLKGNLLGQMAYGAWSGIEQFGSGIAGWFADEYTPTSATQYASAEIREDIGEDNIFKWYNFKTGEWNDVTVLGNTTGQILYDIGNTTANMLPSILTSTAVGAVATPTVGAAVGTLLLGASAGGNAKTEMLNLGYSEGQATAYGLMVGSSEAGLSYLLSGIPGLRGSDGAFSALGNKVISKVDNAMAKAAIALGGNMLDEGLEEGLQTVLENWFKEIATGVDFENPSVDEILYSSLLGSLTAAGFGGGKLAVNGVLNVSNQISAQKSAGKSFNNNLAKNSSSIGDVTSKVLDSKTGLAENTKAYKQAQKIQSRVDKGKRVSNLSVGALAMNLSESQQISAVQSRLSAHVENKTDLSQMSRTIVDIMQGRKVSDKALAKVKANTYAFNALNDALGAKLKKGASIGDIKAAINNYQANASVSKQGGSTLNNKSHNSASFSVSENPDGGFDVVAEADGERMVMMHYETQRQAQAAAYAQTLDMGAEGTRGLVMISESLPDGANLGDTAQAFNAIYTQGRSGKAFSAVRFGETLTAEQRQYAYQLGVMDRALNSSGQKSFVDVLQNGTESDKIKEKEQEGAQNEQGEEESGVHLRGGSERDGGQNPGGQVSSVEGGTRQDQSGRKAQRRPADAAAASGLDLGEEVSAKSLDIKDGVDSAKVKLVKEGSESPAMKQAREMAEARGLKVTFFAGGNLKIRINGKIASVRGYIEGDRVFIRVDHPKYTADQLMRHEICHDMIDNGEIDINEVRERIKALGVDVEYFIDRYSEAYALSGAIMDPDDVWVEIICDSYADMNEFASVAELSEMNTGFLSSLKGEVEASRKDARGPPAQKNGVGKASRETKKLYVFPPYNESYSDANERATRWAHRQDVETGDQRIVSYHDAFYIIEKFDSSELGYQIVGEITKKQYNHYIKEYQAYGENFARQSSEESSNTVSAFDRERNWSGGREYSSDFASIGHRGKDLSLQQVGEKQPEGRNDTSNGNGSLQSSSASVKNGTNKGQLISNTLPLKRKFVDILGRSRNVLGIGNGKYMVQDTKKVNYKFNSIEEAISAENENIIQRYARKNNRSVTWVKNKLAEDSDFLARERRKGKASQDLDFFDYLNENAEDAEITESETVEERELSNREFLANALESMVKTEADKKTLRQYKRRAKALDAMEAELKDLNAKIRELSFATGPRDKVTLTKLKEQKAELEKKIHTKDKALLMLEASAPLQKVLERAKKQATDKVKAKAREDLAKQKTQAKDALDKQAKRYQEMRERASDRRHSSEIREKIKEFKDKLQKTLKHPTDRKYIPGALAQAMIDVCELIDTDTELYKDDGTINKAQERREKTRETLAHLRAEYNNIAKDADPLYKGEYDEAIAEYFDALESEFRGKSLGDMSREELERMYEILHSIDETLKNARKIIGWKEANDAYEAGDVIISEQKKIAGNRKDGKRNAVKKIYDGAGNQSLSPVRRVLEICAYDKNSPLYKLFKGFERGVREAHFFEMGAKKSFEVLTTGKNSKVYENAVYTADGGNKYTDVNGCRFGVSKMQKMQAVLSFEREAANKKTHHIEKGGLVFADIRELTKGNLKNAVDAEYSHKVTGPEAVRLIEQFKKDLEGDSWAQDYMAAARVFFNETAKNAINDVYMKLKHRILATDLAYIPFEVDQNSIVREISAEYDIQKTISSYGMLKEMQGGASNALIMTGLNNVLERHIDQVSTIHGLAIPIRDFNKVWNVKAADGTTNVKEQIQATAGFGATKLIEQTVQDLQGERIKHLPRFYKKLKSNYIGATFFLNMSVVFKQIGSMFSAVSVIGYRDPVRMMGNLIYTFANSKKIAAEVDKYTATAWMRRQGLSDAELQTLKTERRKTKLGKFFDGFGSHAMIQMDYHVALSLWKYAKQDVAKKTGLRGEELLKATAEYYDELIENTQSMTDVLHRPEIQRGDGITTELFGTFKTDLYQNAGNLRIAMGQFAHNRTKENAAQVMKTVSAIMTSALWGSIVTSIVAALRYKVKRYRDEEDDELTAESWLEVQLQDLAQELVGYAIPLGGSEAFDAIANMSEGNFGQAAFSVIPFDAVNDLYSDISTLFPKIVSGEDLSKKDYFNIIRDCGNILGIPTANILRTIEATRLHIEDFKNGEPFSFEAELQDPNAYRLYKAMLEGDKDKIKKASRNFEDEKAITAAIREQLRERDPRIREAAMAYKNGDIGKWDEISKEIADEGVFDQQDIDAAIKSEVNSYSDKVKEAAQAKADEDDEEFEKILDGLFEKFETAIDEEEILDDIDAELDDIKKNEGQPQKSYSHYSTSDINKAFDAGDSELALEILHEIIDDKIEYYIEDARYKASMVGKKFDERKAREEAEKDTTSDLRSSVTSYWKPKYIEAYQNGDQEEMRRIQDILHEIDIYDSVSKTVSGWIK